MPSAIFASSADSLNIFHAEVQKNTAAELIRSGRFEDFLINSLPAASILWESC